MIDRVHANQMSYLQTSTKPNGPLTQPGGPNSNLPGYQPPGWS